MSLFSLSQSNAGLSTSGTTLNLTLFGVAAFSLGWYLGKRSWKPLAMQSYEEFVNADDNSPLSKLAEEYQDFKMVLVVRNDLKMGKGKIAAQCGHATLGLYKKVCRKSPSALQRWEDSAQVKVVTKIDSEEELLELKEKAKNLGVASHITIDAGRTQIAPNSRTVMALLGPDPLVNEISGHLKLL